MTTEEERIYYEGFAAGESDINADWTCAMTEIAGLPDDFDVTPTKVAEFVKRLAKDADRFRRALNAYERGIVQASDGDGYISIFLEAIRDRDATSSSGT